MSMTRRGWTVFTGVVVLVALAVAMAFIPVPYVAEVPGPTYNTLSVVNKTPVISIKGKKTYPTKGNLNMTTVGVIDHLDMLSAVRFWWSDDYAVVPREFVYPPDQSRKQTDSQNDAAFKKSQTSAETAALSYLGYPIAVKVDSLPAGSPSKGKLRGGDIITKLNGHPVTAAQNLIKQVGQQKVGQRVTVAVKHGSKQRTERIKLGRSKDGDPMLGIKITQVQPHPFTIKVSLSNIGGPSAGLMFALGIVDKLTPGPLTNGTFVAGTGTIDDQGAVGPIGGIQQKLVAARDAGATTFLVPAGNCGEATGAAPAGLKLLKVNNLKGAIRALQKQAKGEQTPVCGQ